jgi:hypothetical protein
MISPAAILFTTSGSSAWVGFSICSYSIDGFNTARLLTLIFFGLGGS